MQQRITINLNTDSKTTDKTTILEYCRSHGIAGIETPCGGKGTCGKCKVTVIKPYYKDVLACQTKICDGMEIIVGKKESTGTGTGTAGQDIQTASNARYSIDKEDSMVVLTNGGSISEKFNEHVNRNVVLNEDTLAACDIGTTTVVCYLIDKETGQIISTRSGANPQRSFGADVLSRIDAAARADDNDKANGGLQMMQTQIVSLLNGWISEMLTECGRTKVSRFSVAGNTVMCHLLMGISPEKLGKAPFMPDEYFGRKFNPLDIGLENCQTMIIFPDVSGFVGGDITAGMMETVNCNELTLYLDIGTNGEMALGKGDRYVCCATAAGPAFEGAQIDLGMPAAKGAVDKVWLEGRRIKYSVIGNDRPVGLCGSGLIDALAVLLKAGIIDENGTILSGQELPILFRSYVFEVEAEETAQSTELSLAVHIAPGVYITQEDIRKLQLAKGAIAAGIEVLFKEYGCTPCNIDVLTFAGGFGNYIDKASAAAIGLFPQELLDKAKEVGNAAGNGAVSAALSQEAWERALEISGDMRYIELASYPHFNEMYVEHMNF
ncbi:ASKHA domain-containing protein [Agathobacter rectalis]|uniref:ASKHA domain-containing protein n=1 Tax=Agathobacter rectalis TaxID=39491 RepID=UPI0027D2D180|nr:ASKHA domain-containing protein [Agathobacter rectalis]